MLFVVNKGLGPSKTYGQDTGSMVQMLFGCPQPLSLLLSQSWTLQDMWIPQHCVHETGSRELAREWRWRSFPDLSYGAEARPDTLGFSDRGGVEEIVKIMAAVLNRNGVT